MAVKDSLPHSLSSVNEKRDTVYKKKQLIARTRISSALLFTVAAMFLVPLFFSPGNAQSGWGIALVEAGKYYESGQFERAIDLLEPLLLSTTSTKQEKEEAYRLLAMTNIAIDRLDQAETAITGLLALKPNFETSLRDPPQFIKMVDEGKEKMRNVEVELASGVVESIFDAPASMVVVTAEEIRQRGYTHLGEVIVDLPGFDVVVANGTTYIAAFQRGYRTPFTQRTLLMVNGQVDNHLWSQEAVITRQYPLSNVRKVEVLYGPASAVYGPNAFLGIINVITYDGSQVKNGETLSSINIQAGSYETRDVDLSFKGKVADITYAGSARVFKSEEPDFAGEFGYLEERFLTDDKIWGPILQLEHRNRPFGEYQDPTDDSGVMGSVSYKDLELSLTNWVRREAYGPYYASDKIQPNSLWNKSGSNFVIEHKNRVSDNIRGKSQLLYRTSRTWGTAAESVPDWREGMEGNSFVSLTQWNTDNNSWLFKQQFDMPFKTHLLSGGLKFERKELTKAFDVPGYWEGSFSSSLSADDLGPYGQGAGIGHSSDSTYTPPPLPNVEMPPENLAITEDVGGFLQGIWNVGSFRFNTGIRYDHNSLYGNSFNPRASTVYKFSPEGAVKLWYGEAFQEPAPQLLWGGWSGRQANPDLKPEKARNGELIVMYQTERLFNDVSLYFSKYQNVIKEEAENSGEREIWGLEYKLKYTAPNFIADSSELSGYLNYTFTHVESSDHFNHQSGQWEDGSTELGDIAPHKVNAGVNLPIRSSWNLNIRGNYVGERKLYSRNPLRAKGRTLDSYLVLNGTLNYAYRGLTVSVKLLNLLKKQYFHPGLEQAASGDDFAVRSSGFTNSILPQPGRSYLIKVILN